MLQKLNLTKSNIHPLVYLTFALIAGIWWQETSKNSVHGIILLLSCIVTAVATQTGIRNRSILSSILIGMFALGASLLFLQHANHRKQQKRLCATQCSICGTVTGKEPSSNPAHGSCLTVSLSTIKQSNKAWQSESGSIQLYTKGEDNVAVGDKIEICNIQLKQTTDTSFNNYLTRNNILATVFTNSLNCTLLYRPKWSIRRTLWNIRDSISRRLYKKFSYQTASLFLLTFLGTNLGNKKSAQKTKDLFKAWGILHFLARSGFHLVIFIIIWEFLLRFIPLQFGIKQLILVIISILYGLLSWPSLPFMRAFSAFLLYKIGPWANTRGSSLYLLALICFIMLILNPIQLLFLDFQLSFGLTFVLTWFSQLQQQKRVFAKNC